MNKYERICKEWAKGCSISLNFPPEKCKECTDAFLTAVKKNVNEDKTKGDDE